MKRAWIILAGILCIVAGCQTTTSDPGGALASATLDRNEKLLLRVDQLVGTYDVTVQRAALNGEDPKQKDQWAIIGSAGVEGYPGKFRATESAEPIGGAALESFLLDGTPVKISQQPGTHLIAKVIPERQNTARVVGVFVQVSSVGKQVESFSVPFDLTCDMGRVYEVYAREIPMTGNANVNSDLQSAVR